MCAVLESGLDCKYLCVKYGNPVRAHMIQVIKHRHSADLAISVRVLAHQQRFVRDREGNH